MHLTSEACGRACPENRPHCATPESLAEWDHDTYVRNTADSFFFDRLDMRECQEEALANVLDSETKLASSADGVGGYSLRLKLDQWDKVHLSTSQSSMASERTLGRLGGVVWTRHVSNATLERQFVALTELNKDRSVVTEES
eukprot:gene26772-4353_t